MLNLVFADPSERPPAPRDPASAGVHVWRDVDSRIVAWGYSSGQERWMHWPRLATFRFTAAGSAITAFPAPGANPGHIADTCLRSVVPLALQALGREALHASAVLGPSGVVAFCATSQTGKSTVAFGLARRGFPQWADDAVVVEMADDRRSRAEHGIEVSPLPFAVRLRPQTAEFYAAGEISMERMTPGVPEPAMRIMPARTPAPLAVICILERKPAAAFSGAVDIRRLEASESFVGLLAHAYCFDPADPERKASMLRHYLEIAARVPIFHVTVSDDLSRLPAALDAIARLIDAREAGSNVERGMSNAAGGTGSDPNVEGGMSNAGGRECGS